MIQDSGFRSQTRHWKVRSHAGLLHPYCRGLKPWSGPPLQVADRVVARGGGANWWSTLTGRLKVQRLVQRYRGGARLLEAAKDADSYGLCSHTRVALGKCGPGTISPAPGL